MSLQEESMLVSVGIKNYEGRKNCQEGEEIIERECHATNAGRFHKHLFPNCKELKEVNAACRKIRNIVYKYTLPWEEDKVRLLPTVNYLDFMKDISKAIMDKDDNLKKFKEVYYERVEESIRTLGTLGKKEEYLYPEELDSRFETKFSFYPVPNSGHFIVNIANEDREEIRKKIENETKERITESQKDNYRRIYKVVQHMAETLADKDAIFRDSLVNNVKDILYMARKFNVTNDPEVEETIKKIEDLTKEDPTILRDNKIVREKVAKNASDLADDILKKMGIIR